MCKFSILVVWDAKYKISENLMAKFIFSYISKPNPKARTALSQIYQEQIFLFPGQIDVKILLSKLYCHYLVSVLLFIYLIITSICLISFQVYFHSPFYMQGSRTVCWNRARHKKLPHL